MKAKQKGSIAIQPQYAILRFAKYKGPEIGRIEAILSEPKANQQEHIRLKRDSLAKYFPSSYTPAQIEQDIRKGLELLKRQRERNHDAR